MTDAYSQAADLLERAAQLDRQARGDEALDLLENYAEWPAPYNERGLLLRAAILAPRDPISALDELPEDAGEFATADGRIGFLVTSARAYRLARNLRTAEAFLRAAEAEIPDGDHPERYRIAYLRAHMKWNQRDYDPYDPNLLLALDASDPVVRFDAYNLRAWMYAGLANHREHLHGLLECIRMYLASPNECASRAVAVTLHSLLDFAWELGAADVAAEGLRAFNTLEWTPELRLYRFLCLRALAWNAFLAGDAPRVDEQIRAAISDAPAPGWALMAHLDRAYIASLSSTEPITGELLNSVRALADEIDWRATAHEERMSLVTLGTLLAPIDHGAAERYLSIYHRLYAHSMYEGVEASHEPPRILGMQRYADGRVEQYRGNTPLAVRMLETAYDTFIGVDHVFRAALAARALYEVTGDRRWLSAARSHASAFPNSPIS